LIVKSGAESPTFSVVVSVTTWDLLSPFAGSAVRS